MSASAVSVSDSGFRVISGGSTGVDIAALRAAHKLSIPTCGWTAQGYWNGTQSDMSLKDVYGLQAVQQRGYVEKEEKNVELCDGLLAFRVRLPKTGRGTESVVQCARFGKYKHQALEQERDVVLYGDNPKRPVLVLWDVTDKRVECDVDVILAFLYNYNIQALMVTGSTATDCEPLMEHLFDRVLRRYTLLRTQLQSTLRGQLMSARQEVTLSKSTLEVKQREWTLEKSELVKRHAELVRNIHERNQAIDDERHARSQVRHILKHHRHLFTESLPCSITYSSNVNGDGCIFVAQGVDQPTTVIITCVPSVDTQEAYDRRGPLVAHFLFNAWCANMLA